MQLTVNEVKPTKSGKSVVVKAGGKDYFAKADAGIQAGMTIEAETEDSDYQGKTLVWITKYKTVSAASAPHANVNSAPVWLPMASNVVAHALNAGVLKEPSEVKVWVLAVKEAVDGAQSETPF